MYYWILVCGNDERCTELVSLGSDLCLTPFRLQRSDSHVQCNFTSSGLYTLHCPVTVN